jgi:cell division protease FtsH
LIPLINKTDYVDNNTDLTTLSRNYASGVYSEVLIDGNKAFATLSGSKVSEAGIEKQKRDVVVLPDNNSLKDLGLNNPKIKTKIEVRDQTSNKFWSEMLPTIIGFILFFIVAIILIGRM